MSRSCSFFGSVATNFDSLNEPVGVAVFVVVVSCCFVVRHLLQYPGGGDSIAGILRGGFFGLFVRLFHENMFYCLYRSSFRKLLSTTFS